MSRLGPPAPRSDGPPQRPVRLEVFAVEPAAVQITWGRLGPGPVRFRAADAEVEIVADGGPGGVELTNLPAGNLAIEVDGDGLPSSVRLSTRTVDPPPGAELFRLATVNDVHLGQDTFGYLGRMREIPEPPELHPVRCARSALADAIAWGAANVVVKGDLTQASTDEHWDLVGSVLTGLPVDFEIVPGNHEFNRKSTVLPEEASIEHGLRVTRGVEVADFPGLRLITTDTAQPITDAGRIAHAAPQIVEAAAGAGDRWVLVAIHHHPQRFRWKTFLPAGIPGPEARSFLNDLAAAHPDTLVTTGHTHRHRRHDRWPVVVTEIGSTKDYPGAWAGYVVHEGGIRQVVRRITETSCIRWTEWTRRAALGAWGHWSPGTLDQRCFTLTKSKS